MRTFKYIVGYIGTIKHHAETDHKFYKGQRVRIFEVDEATGYSAVAFPQVGDGRDSDGPWFLDDDDLV